MSEREQLDKLSDHELVEFWSKLQAPEIRGTDKQRWFARIVNFLLTERGVPHEVGKAA